MTKFYYLSNTGFKEMPITVIYPINSTFGIDGGTDTMQLSYYCSQDFNIPVDTPIKIVNGTNNLFFVVKDSDYNDLPFNNLTTNQKERLCTLTLVEPFEIARGYRLQPCKFAENTYEIGYVIERIKTLSRFDFYNGIGNYNFDKLKTRLEFSSTTVYLAIYEIARMYDCIPYFVYNEAIKKWMLQFQSQTGEEKRHNINILDNTNQVINHGENLGKKVYMEASNVSFTEPIEILNSNYITTDDSPSFKDDLSNLAIEVDGTIQKLEKLTLLGQQVDWDNTTGGNKPIQNSGYNETTNAWEFYNNASIDFYNYNRVDDNVQSLHCNSMIITKREYDNLTTEQKEDRSKIYIYYENNIIYLNELYKLFYRVTYTDNNGNDTYKPINTAIISKTIPRDPDTGKSYVSKGTLYAETPPSGWFSSAKTVLNVWDNISKIVLYTTLSKKIPMFIHNNSKYDDTVFYNQTSGEINIDKSINVLQSYIDTMSSETIIKTSVFKNWEDIPKEGEIIVDNDTEYLVNSLSIIEEREFYSCTFSLVKNHAKKREYMEADTSLVLTKIPTEDIIDTYFIDNFKITYSIDKEIPKVLDLSNLELNYYHNFIFPSTGKQLKQLWLWSAFKFENSDTDGLFKDKPLSFVGGNSIFFTISAKNNFIWKLIVNDEGNISPVYYANSGGATIQAIFDLADEDRHIWYRSILNGNPIKDKYETMNYTLQLNYTGINDTIVTPNLADSILNGSKYNTKVLVYGRTHRQNEPINIEGGVDVGDVTVLIDRPNQCIHVKFEEQEIPHKSFILLLDNKPIFVKNLKDWQATAKSFNIYYSIENGYQAQTGVRPYDK